MAVNTKELTFDDILVLQRIDANSVVEKFSSQINSSFFEAANQLGTLKLKGFVDIASSPGMSKVSLSEEGKSVLEMAARKAKEKLVELDIAILRAVAGGARDTVMVNQMLNIRSSDLAFHLNRLLVQGLIDYNFRRGSVLIALTSEGFKQANAAEAQAPAREPAGQEQRVPRADPFSPFRRLREMASGGKRAPTIMDELAPSAESEAGLKPTTEQIKRRMMESKMDYYMRKWRGALMILGAVAVILILGLIYVFITGTTGG